MVRIAIKSKSRCVGTAISHAVNLLESSCKNVPARIMTYLSGPCTFGPGAVVGLDLKEVIRTWTELKEDDHQQSIEVCLFYIIFFYETFLALYK